jgi:hypothetical protein
LPDFSTRPRPSGLSPTDFVLLIVAVGVLAVSGQLAWRASADLSRAERSVEALRRQGGGSAASGTAAAASPLDRFVSPLLLTADGSPSRVVRDLVARMPDDVRLEQLDLEYGEGLEVELRVVARNAAAYDQLIENLATSERFFSLVPGSENRDGEVRSVVRLRYRATGPGSGP